VLTGEQAVPAADNDIGQSHRIRTALADRVQVDDGGGRRAGIGIGEPGRLNHRTGAEAIDAARARIRDRRPAGAERVEKFRRVDNVAHSGSALLPLRLSPAAIITQAPGQDAWLLRNPATCWPVRAP